MLSVFNIDSTFPIAVYIHFALGTCESVELELIEVTIGSVEAVKKPELLVSSEV